MTLCPVDQIFVLCFEAQDAWRWCSGCVHVASERDAHHPDSFQAFLFLICRVWRCSTRPSRSAGTTRPRRVCPRDAWRNASSQCSATPTSSPPTTSSPSSQWLPTWTSPLKNPAYDAVLSANQNAACARETRTTNDSSKTSAGIIQRLTRTHGGTQEINHTRDVSVCTKTSFMHKRKTFVFYMNSSSYDFSIKRVKLWTRFCES